VDLAGGDLHKHGLGDGHKSVKAATSGDTMTKWFLK